MWSHDVVGTSIGLATDLKLGQYLKIPPRVMFLTQVWGTIVGKSSNVSIGFPMCLNLPLQSQVPSSIMVKVFPGLHYF